jgi:ribosomal protein S12 methylthiotransferase
MSKSISMITLGCPKNEADSQVLAGELLRHGFEMIDEPVQSNILLINTCGFIEAAKQESINTILQAVQLKADHPEKKIYVWGCLSERYRGEIEKLIPEADGFFGVEPFEEICRLIADHSYKWDESFYPNRMHSAQAHTAYLKIADGCDHLCTFCAIPGIKGRYKSRPPDSITAEARALAQKGVQELILVAQDTTFWGQDLPGQPSLVRLLEALLEISALQWIRVMYVHPARLSAEFLNLIALEPRICSYLDMPLQHISPAVLRRMGRNTPPEMIKEAIENIRSLIPDITLRTAFITGFPGETSKDFEDLEAFIRQVRFDRLGVFVYSREEGTPAFSLKPRISLKTAEDRYHRLMDLQSVISEELNRKMVNRVMDVLIDGYDGQQHCFYGRTQGDAPEIDQLVWIKEDVPIGRVIPVRITESAAYDLYGEPVLLNKGKNRC